MSLDAWTIGLTVAGFVLNMFVFLHYLPRLVEWFDPSFGEEDPE